MNHEDRIFMKHFSWVLIGLVIFTLVIIALANLIHSTLTPSENPSRAAKKLERIQPIAAVYVGEEALAAAQAAAAAEVASAPAEPEGAFGGSMDGQSIYQQVCLACHASGAAGAPKLVAGDWAERLPKGEDQLVSNALNGIGAMPPKGGRPDLTEDQIRVTVEWMLSQVQ